MLSRLMSEQPAAFSAVPDAISYTEAGDLAAVRAFVRSRASALGLPPARAELLLLAVNELATNTLQHTGGGGRVRMWTQDGLVVCDVVDGGPPRGFGRAMPPADAVGGRGLAIVERVCDEVSTSTGPGGTLVRLRLRL
jgi:anti-sigma regulatory factor (Ser/Thr protein kinase)